MCKKIIYSNGVNVELAYHTDEVVFGEKKFKKRFLVCSTKDYDGKFSDIRFDLDNDVDIYGEIKGSEYTTEETLPIHRAIAYGISDYLEDDDLKKMLKSIESFKIRLVEDFTNSEFSNKIYETLVNEIGN